MNAQDRLAEIAAGSRIDLDHMKQWVQPMTAADCGAFMVSTRDDLALEKYQHYRHCFQSSFRGDETVAYRLVNAIGPVDSLLVLGELSFGKKPLKYPRPEGSGLDVWAPLIDEVLGRSWDEVISSGEPIVLCEGYKKCCSLLSALQKPAIALPGLWFERKQVPASLEPFLQQRRQITQVFDNEADPEKAALV